MSIRKTMLYVAVAALVSAAGTNATPPDIGWPMDMGLKILQLPENAGHGELTLTFKPSTYYDDICSEVEVEVETRHGLNFLGSPKWTVPVNSSTEYSTVLNIDIPDNDTCGVRVHVICGSTRRTGAVYFVTTGDTIETYGGHPRGGTHRPDSTWSQRERAWYSPEELQKELEFFLDLGGCYEDCRAFVDSAIGTLEPTDTPNVFRVRTSIYNSISLHCDWGLKIVPADREMREALRPSKVKEAPPGDSSKTGDTSKPQGSLDNDPNLRGTGAISLERVTGLTGGNKLPIDETITFYLRVNNNTGSNMSGITNGFRVYSPDGADWAGTVGDTLGTLAWKYYFDLLYMITYYSETGSGADTVAFSGVHISHGGLPNAFNDTAYTISIGPIDAADIGRTICLDSSFFRPSGVWKWTGGGGNDQFPTWDGPHC